MNMINIPTVDVADLPPSQENIILKFIKHHYLIQHLIGLGVSLLVIFFIVAPLLIGLLFPYFGIMNSYDRVIACSELPADASNASLFQPVQCSTLTGKSVIGCAIATGSSYVAPKDATREQKTLCPQLVANPVADGSTNNSVPVLKTHENTVKLFTTIIVTLIAIVLYITTRFVIYFVKHRRKASLRDSRIN